MFLLYFLEKKSLAEVLLTHGEEKCLCRISSFYEKGKTKQLFSKSKTFLSKTFLNQSEPMSFCKLQT